MPTQVTTTHGANVQAMVQKSQARALPRTPHAGQAGAAGARADATAQDFAAVLRRTNAQRLDTQRMESGHAVVP